MHIGPGRIALTLGGPHGILSTVSSPGNHCALHSVINSGCSHVFRVNHLSCSSRNLVLVAGSNRLSRRIVRPGCRIRGACITALRNGVSNAMYHQLIAANIRLSSN